MSEADPDLALSCPICMERYSETRYPIAPYCGHSICKECGDKRKSNQCVSCTEHCFYDVTNKTSPWPSNEWRKSFALLDLVKLYTLMAEERNELKSKYEKAIPFVPNDIDYMECSKCKTMEKREKLKICDGCVREVNVDWKEMTEDEILPFILCAFCCHEHHMGHTLTKYLPWKLDHLRASTVSDGKSTVASMDELCVYEFEKGKEELGKWNDKFDVFRTLPVNNYRNGLSIAHTLKMESDIVTRVSEDCLPPLRKYRKVVTDATTRLEKFVEEIVLGKVDYGTSKAVKEVEEITERLNKSSEVVISKEKYEERIRELENNIEDLNKIPTKALVGESAEHVQRLLTTVSSFVWPAGPTDIDFLYMTVSHTMDLLGVEMYRRNIKRAGSFGAKGILKISDPTTELVDVDFTVLDGSEKDALQLVTFQESVRLFPSTEYLLELTVDKDTRLFYGSGGLEKIALRRHPGCSVSFSAHPGTSTGRSSDTNTEWGQFAGFFLRLVDEWLV